MPVKELFTLRRYEPSLRAEWDELVKASVNGTLLHTRCFYDHNLHNREDECSVLFSKKGKPVAAIPLVRLTTHTGSILHSHPRATYGGFIFSDDLSIEDAVKIVDLVIDQARLAGVQEIIIRNPFRILYRHPSDLMDYALWLKGFTIKCRELEMAIPLADTRTLEKAYSKGARSGAHKAAKHLVMTESKDYKAFWQLLERSLSEKYKVKPTHSLDDMQRLIKLAGNEAVKLFTAYYNSELIAGILVFIVNNQVVHAQYISQNLEYQHFRPLNGLVDHIARWALEKKFRYFNLGKVNEENGMIYNTGLFNFKKSHGALGILRETMHLKLQ